MYRFKVTKVEDVDLQRICRECEEDADAQAILVTGTNALLMLRDDFLSQFELADGIFVAGQKLQDAWGWSKVQVLQERSAVSFWAYTYAHPSQSIKGWRAHTIPLNRAGEAVLAVLDARKYHRELEVKVHVI